MSYPLIQQGSRKVIFLPKYIHLLALWQVFHDVTNYCIKKWKRMIRLMKILCNLFSCKIFMQNIRSSLLCLRGSRSPFRCYQVEDICLDNACAFWVILPLFCESCMRDSFAIDLLCNWIALKQWFLHVWFSSLCFCFCLAFLNFLWAALTRRAF